jgi:hypothetical protein
MPTTRGGLEPALIINKSTKQEVPCMFNPYEYTINKSNQYQQGETKGSNIPRITFSQGGAQMLRMRLVFDTYDLGMDVRLHTDPLWRMMMIDEDRIDQTTGKGEPPHCIFRWGRFQFEAVITQMNQKMSLFLKDGTPVRTEMEVTFQQVEDETRHERQNPTSGGGTAPKTRLLYAGDRLDWIAYDEYGDSTKWRRIAEANQINDPLRLRAGQVIIVPPLVEG